MYAAKVIFFSEKAKVFLRKLKLISGKGTPKKSSKAPKCLVLK